MRPATTRTTLCASLQVTTYCSSAILSAGSPMWGWISRATEAAKIGKTDKIRCATAGGAATNYVATTPAAGRRNRSYDVPRCAPRSPTWGNRNDGNNTAVCRNRNDSCTTAAHTEDARIVPPTTGDVRFPRASIHRSSRRIVESAAPAPVQFVLSAKPWSVPLNWYCPVRRQRFTCKISVAPTKGRLVRTILASPLNGGLVAVPPAGSLKRSDLVRAIRWPPQALPSVPYAGCHPLAPVLGPPPVCVPRSHCADLLGRPAQPPRRPIAPPVHLEPYLVELSESLLMMCHGDNGEEGGPLRQHLVDGMLGFRVQCGRALVDQEQDVSRGLLGRGMRRNLGTISAISCSNNRRVMRTGTRRNRNRSAFHVGHTAPDYASITRTCPRRPETSPRPALGRRSRVDQEQDVGTFPNVPRRPRKAMPMSHDSQRVTTAPQQCHNATRHCDTVGTQLLGCGLC